jgi:hypothetical protein
MSHDFREFLGIFGGPITANVENVHLLPLPRVRGSLEKVAHIGRDHVCVN